MGAAGSVPAGVGDILVEAAVAVAVADRTLVVGHHILPLVVAVAEVILSAGVLHSIPHFIPRLLAEQPFIRRPAEEMLR